MTFRSDLEAARTRATALVIELEHERAKTAATLADLAIVRKRRSNLEERLGDGTWIERNRVLAGVLYAAIWIVGVAFVLVTLSPVAELW